MRRRSTKEKVRLYPCPGNQDRGFLSEEVVAVEPPRQKDCVRYQTDTTIFDVQKRTLRERSVLFSEVQINWNGECGDDETQFVCLEFEWDEDQEKMVSIKDKYSLVTLTQSVPEKIIRREPFDAENFRKIKEVMIKTFLEEIKSGCEWRSVKEMLGSQRRIGMFESLNTE